MGLDGDGLEPLGLLRTQLRGHDVIAQPHRIAVSIVIKGVVRRRDLDHRKGFGPCVVGLTVRGAAVNDANGDLSTIDAQFHQ